MCDFAIFILTHGRPNNQKTAKALRESGYTGKIVYVVDDEDQTLNDYLALKNDSVEVFHKEQYIQTTDTAEIKPYRNFAVFARNAVEVLARDFGYKFFGMFDDDVIRFRHRWESDGKLCSTGVVDMDSVIKYHLSFMRSSGVATMSFGINTNFMERIENQDFSNSKYRMCFNTYLRNSDFKVDWKLNMWEDVITSVLSNRNQLWLQSPFIQADMSEIGSNNVGGNSDTYRAVPLHRQQFYVKVACPDCFVIKPRNGSLVPWSRYNAMCNKIISGKYKRMV